MQSGDSIVEQYREEIREWRELCNKAEAKAQKLTEALELISKRDCTPHAGRFPCARCIALSALDEVGNND